MKRYLTVLEVSQKQNYIFRTDRLAENIGASMIIRQITEMGDNNRNVISRYRKNLFFEGGGKSVFEFDQANDAEKFTREVSEDVLRKYPGVELFMATRAYDHENDSVIDAINNLFGDLEVKKSQRASSAMLYGIGLTEKCIDTGLPAVENDPVFGGCISAESQAKLKASRTQEEAYSDVLPDGNWKFASEFEDLGGTENKKSYIAIVATDGNRMGQKFKNYREKFTIDHKSLSKSEYNDLYREDFSILSREIDDTYRAAVKDVTTWLAEHVEQLRDNDVISVRRGKENVLPFRPLILSGDDICFVTDARLGLSLAERLLEAVEKRGEELSRHRAGFDMHACAGVAMVKSHYPFFRAHELAEELCHSAKTEISGKVNNEEKPDEPVIDWHIAQGELEGSLSEIRAEKYDDKKLTNKPYYLKDGHGDKSFSTYRKRFRQFTSQNIGRGTVKEYRDALNEGDDAVEEYWNYKRMDRKGLEKKSRGLDFDVIEMLDVYHDLDEKGETE